MKIVKLLRYPLLFLAVVLLPASLATVFLEIPGMLEHRGVIANADNWYFISALTGYSMGYLLIYESLQGINRLFDAPIYSKRIRRTYLLTNAIVAIILFAVLNASISILYTSQSITFAHTLIFIDLPWVAVQMLLLLFFVRSDSLYN